MPPIRKPTVVKPAPVQPRADLPSVDITKLLANTKTAALGNKLLMADIQKGNANGRLDYLELPNLDAATRAAVAALMSGQPDGIPSSPPGSPTSPGRPTAPLFSGVAAEKPGSLQREAARYHRYDYSDEQLLTKKGLPGEAFNPKLDAYRFNPFVKGESNLADPSKLRAQARFLELTGDTGKLRPTAKSQRNELIKDLRQEMTVTGLDALELAYFPTEKALAIVKRAAIAAHINPADVLITLNGNQVRLPAFERKLGELDAVPIRPYKPTLIAVTDAQARNDSAEAARDAKEREQQKTFFEQHPGAAWSEYTRFAESKTSNPADERFWGAMEAWFRKGDAVDWQDPGWG